jgi:hypothetical protein
MSLWDSLLEVLEGFFTPLLIAAGDDYVIIR